MITIDLSALKGPSRVYTLVDPLPPSRVAVDCGLLVLSLIRPMMEDVDGGSPKELWGLNRAMDLLAPRGIVVNCDKSYRFYHQHRFQRGRFPIVALRTGPDFNDRIVIIPGIRMVEFAPEFNSPVKLASPCSVKRLICRGEFNQPITLLDGIRYLEMGCEFNHPLVLPDSIETALLGCNFSHPIILPEGMKKFRVCILDGCFNHPLVLPNSLISLTLGEAFNHPITLHEGLQEANFGDDFDQPLSLPSTLTELLFGAYSRYNHPLQFPDGLEVLHLSNAFDHPIVLPDSLTTLGIGKMFTRRCSFPPQLKKLFWDCNRPIDVDLPPTLREMHFGEEFQHAVHLPEGLQKAYFWNYTLPLVLPSSLKEIRFLGTYDLPVVLPPGCIRRKY